MDDGQRHDDAVVLTAPRDLLDALAARAAPAPAPDGEPRSLVHTLLRPDDQVRLRFELVNGRVDPATNTIVELTGPDGIFYVISFGSQHTVEDPIATGTTPATAAVAHRAAGESRIAVAIPAGTPFTVATLLDLAAFRLRLDARAAGGAAKDDTEEPSGDVTALEVPTSLVLSPIAGERFIAETQPVTRGGVTELWRARLARMSDGRPVEPPAGPTVVRAIWSRPDDPRFDRPVDARDRAALVTQTTTGAARADHPPPVLADVAGGVRRRRGGLGRRGPGRLSAPDRERPGPARRGRRTGLPRAVRASGEHHDTGRARVRRDADGTTTATLTSDEFLAVSAAALSSPRRSCPTMGGRCRSPTSARPTRARARSARTGDMPNGSNISTAKARVLTRGGEDLRISYESTDRAGPVGIAFGLPVVFVSEDESYEPPPGRRRETVLAKLVRVVRRRRQRGRFAGADLGGQPVGLGRPPDEPGRRCGFGADRRTASGSARPAGHRRRRPGDVEDSCATLGRPAIFPAVDAAWVVDVASTTAFGGDPPETEVTVAQR